MSEDTARVLGVSEPPTAALVKGPSAALRQVALDKRSPPAGTPPPLAAGEGGVGQAGFRSRKHVIAVCRQLVEAGFLDLVMLTARSTTSADLGAAEAHLRLELPPYEPLVIANIGRHLVSVAHYYCQNGDLVADPDVVFFAGYGPWVPLEITLPPPGGYGVYAEVSPDGAEITQVDLRGQAELADFVEELWVHNLDVQGWAEGGRREEG